MESIVQILLSIHETLSSLDLEVDDDAKEGLVIKIDEWLHEGMSVGDVCDELIELHADQLKIAGLKYLIDLTINDTMGFIH